MTAADLIKQLSELPPETEVKVWDLYYGDPLPIGEVSFYGGASPMAILEPSNKE